MNDIRDEAIGMVRTNDPSTSIAAANVVSETKESIQEAVLAMHQRHPDGLTDSELRAKMDAHVGFERAHSTYRTRRAELTDGGVIIPTEQRRRNPKGSQETVWRVRKEGEPIPTPVKKPTLSDEIEMLRASNKMMSDLVEGFDGRMVAAVAAEREACKQVAISYRDKVPDHETPWSAANDIAALIGSRGTG